MANIAKFSNINSKVKGMYSKNLKQEDYDDLIKQNDIKYIIILLKEKIVDLKDIENNSNRIEIEKALYEIMEKKANKIKRLLDSNSKEILNIYMKKYKIENKLDKIYFEELYLKINKTNNKTLIDIIGKQIDLFNILWIYRAKKYHNFTEKEIKEKLINVMYKLNKEQINELINGKDYKEIVEETIYKGIFENNENIEINIKKYLYKLYKKYFEENTFSVSVVICYMLLKEIELKNIINIIEGVRYKLSKKEIQKRIIN